MGKTCLPEWRRQAKCYRTKEVMPYCHGRKIRQPPQKGTRQDRERRFQHKQPPSPQRRWEQVEENSRRQHAARQQAGERRLLPAVTGIRRQCCVQWGSERQASSSARKEDRHNGRRSTHTQVKKRGRGHRGRSRGEGCLPNDYTPASLLLQPAARRPFCPSPRPKRKVLPHCLMCCLSCPPHTKIDSHCPSLSSSSQPRMVGMVVPQWRNGLPVFSRRPAHLPSHLPPPSSCQWWWLSCC